MQIIRKQKGGDRKRGLTYGKNINWKPGQMCIGIVHGIGEKGNETTELYKPDEWGKPDGGFHILQRLGDKYGFNIMYCQSQVGANDTIEEISYMLEQAVEDPDMQADPNLLVLAGLSWGGRRLKLYASKGFPGKYKPFAITRLAAGWVDVDDWTPTIEHNIPTLLIHSEADAVVPEKYSFTSYVEGRKKNPNAPIYYIELKDDPKYTDEHNITRVLSDTVINPAIIDPTYMVPKMSWLQWVLMNSWSDQPVSPEATYIDRPKEEPVPAPIPEVPSIPPSEPEAPPIEPETPSEPTVPIPEVPVPEVPPVVDPVPEPVKKVYLLRTTHSHEYKLPPSGIFEAWWSDGTKSIVRAPKGDQIKSSYMVVLGVDVLPQGSTTRGAFKVGDNMVIPLLKFMLDLSRGGDIQVGPYK
jgi:hypothetical protein